MYLEIEYFITNGAAKKWIFSVMGSQFIAERNFLFDT